MSYTNELTAQILKFLFSKGIFAWREDTVGIPMLDGRLRPAGKKGKPDIMGYLPPNGRGLGIEVKTGKDRMRPEQIGFKANSERMGAVYMVVHDYEDFLKQYGQFSQP